MNKRIYKADLHCHTSEGSGCSSESGAQTVEKYIEFGFTSLVVTNHVQFWECDPELKSGYGSYDWLIDRAYDASEIAREAAGDRLHVLSGMEVCDRDTKNDYLIYGLTREMAKGINMCYSHIEEISDHVRSCGGVIIQAHPMRMGMRLMSPQIYDGVEIFNNSADWLYVNPMAQMWAQINCLDKTKILTAGNDHHNPKDMPTAGILTSEPIVTDEDLVRILVSKDFSIFHETKMNGGD